MTLLKKAVVVAMLLATVPASAQTNPPQAAAGNHVINEAALMPRNVSPKPDFVIRPAGESQLLIKFVDSAKVRPQADGTARATVNVDMNKFDALVTQYGLTFTSIFGRKSTGELAALEHRAAVLSNKQQPDLAGMMYVHGPAGALQQAANALVKLDVVEYIYFHPEMKPSNPEPQAAKPQPAGRPMGNDGGIAGPPPCGGCGDDMNCIGASCFTVHDDPFCPTEACCNTVTDIRPTCGEEGGTWDIICVAVAHLYCMPDIEPIGADRCKSAVNGSCFEAHVTPGCLTEACCNTVCDLDPFCCEVTGEWDEACVTLANLNCEASLPPGATPDLTDRQGYLTLLDYDLQPGPPPNDLSFPAPDFPGYAGDGMWLFDTQYLTDHPQAPVPQRYTGLYGLGRQLHEQYGVGPYNMARGRGIKVAVIEWAFYQGHEDLNVISEPGQTLITIPEVGHPDHATACLGIINAQINGFGMNGIAPDSQAYFFPLTSVEEGPREFAAWVSMMQTLGAGDVVSCSYGPGGSNLNCVAATHTLISLSAALGITVCIAAGNDCVNLDDVDSPNTDSGGIVVGACCPGRPFYRLPFSNFYQDGNPATDPNVVHVSGWGEAVPTLGGNANLFFPGGNWNRSYCTNFNGTSAACPSVAGIAACLQGLAKQFYGIPLMPAQIRASIAATGFPQQGIPNPENLPGFPDEVGCAGDYDPDEGPNKIGAYPRPERAGAFILNQWSVGFNGSPNVDGITIIRGNLVFGNVFSVMAQDNNYLVVNSQYTPRKHRPQLPAPANQVTYLGSGQVTDVMLSGHVNAPVNNFTVNYEFTQLPATTIAYLTTEAYDWTLNKWVLLGFHQAFTPVPGLQFEPNGDVWNAVMATSAQRFINQAAGNSVKIRQYVLGLGVNNAFAMRWDWLDINVAGSFPGGLGGPG